MNRKTFNDLLKDYNKISNNLQLIENKIKSRALEICEKNPSLKLTIDDNTYPLGYFIVGLRNGNTKVLVALEIIKFMEEYNKNNYPHVQGELF